MVTFLNFSKPFLTYFVFIGKEEQNMIALLFNYTVYYMTIVDVEPDTELLSMIQILCTNQF